VSGARPRRRRRNAQADADSSAQDAVANTADATAKEGGHAVSGLRAPAPDAGRSTGPVSITGTGSATATAPGSTAISGYIHELTVQRLALREPAPWPHQVGALPARAGSFQQRVQAERLRRSVDGGGTVVLRQAVLSGMGGVGKTQLAADHAHTAWDTGELDVLVWITASSRGDVVAGLARAAVELCRADPDDAEQAATAFLAWLAPPPLVLAGSAAAVPMCRWMVVLDDLADPDDLRGLWPPASPHGRTLVTTRRRDAALTGADRELVDVGLYTPAEALHYLTERLAAYQRAEPHTELTALGADLGRLPLALAQASAYIIDSLVSCADYRALLADRATAPRDTAPDRLPDQQTLTVAATWSLSVDHADTLGQRGLARPMLHLAAFLDANGIPDAVLTSTPARAYLSRNRTWQATPHPAVEGQTPALAPDPVPARDARLALAALHRLSLIDYTPAAPTTSVRVHQLIQRATREGLGDQEDPAAPAADALLDAWPEQESNTALAQALRANTAAVIRHGGPALLRTDVHPLLVRVGRSLSEAGNVDAAVRHYTRLLERATQYLGGERPSVLAVRRHLATERGQRGEVAVAVAGLNALLNDDLRLLGRDSEETLATRHELIWWQWAAGDRDGAERDLAALLDDRLRIQGADHPDSLETRHNLYAAWLEAGLIPEALEAYQVLLSDRLRVQGPDHADTIGARHQVVALHGLAGDPDNAIQAMTEIVKDRARVQGSHHPLTLAARQVLARIQGEAGNTVTAIDALDQLHRDRVEVLGPDHPDTMNTRRLLAHLTAVGQSKDHALAMLTDLLQQQRRVLGPSHPDTLDTRHELYALWATTGQTDQAREAFADLLADRNRIQGPNHPQTLRARQALQALTHQDEEGQTG
jgi:tetratricopeptide (TPR) repeat protein